MAPLNKPYDRLAKELTREAPALLARVLPLAPPGASLSLRSLSPETSPPVRLVDSIAVLSVDGAAEFVFHVEFCVSFNDEVLVVMACYGGSLALQYRGYRIDSTLVLLDRRRKVPPLPGVAVFVNHGTRIFHDFRTVRLWELSPAPVIEQDDLRFISWAVLMNSTEEQVGQIAARVRSCGDEEIVARFLILGSLRYHRSDLEQMLGGAHMGLMEAIMEGSSLVKDVVERSERRAHDRGLEEGRHEGLQAGRREILRAALAERFPGLEADPAVDGISGTDAVSKILTAAYSGSTRAELERLIREASNH